MGAGAEWLKQTQIFPRMGLNLESPVESIVSDETQDIGARILVHGGLAGMECG